nr:hypothetical protein [Faecalibacterium prausnitzii]
MGVVFAGAIPFNDFMPASIAKTLSVLQGEKPVLIVTEGWVDVCKEPEGE